MVGKRNHSTGSVRKADFRRLTAVSRDYPLRRDPLARPRYPNPRPNGNPLRRRQFFGRQLVTVLKHNYDHRPFCPTLNCSQRPHSPHPMLQSPTPLRYKTSQVLQYNFRLAYNHCTGNQVTFLIRPDKIHPRNRDG